ncbi:DUF4365 domain-containing protein [Flavobacterium sp. MK4S-17]|uniref:DUF4365 domain-containing protein n=1 Tax=Flavobacterium sp. MK4S-17 TaxID=2543737 RepID=UPI00135A0667|nr:DUF4365 domain-containing protein [Flavobacterium sp. MK4S-17]
MDVNYRIRKKNEATGVRIVSQYVQEFWECGWQPFDSRNDEGIDGLILMLRKGIDLGVRINVQVKCGPTYISSINKDEIRISIDDEKGLLKHIEYWKKQLEPAILIFVNPSLPIKDKHGNILKDINNKILLKENRLHAKAWWVNLKDENLQPDNTKTIVRIPRVNVFGEHSKGDFLKLIRPLQSIEHLPKILLNSDSKGLLLSMNLKKDAREFFKSWKNKKAVFCKAINSEIIISKIGWRHILHNRRGKERRIISLKLLGIAKQIIEEVTEKYLLNQKETISRLEQKYGLRAVINDKITGTQVVQVIILRVTNKHTQETIWKFYSVHYRR